jgi:hypothetical protein
VHASQKHALVFRLPPPRDAAQPPWRMYVMPLPGDEVVMGHALDLVHPEPAAPCV